MTRVGGIDGSGVVAGVGAGVTAGASGGMRVRNSSVGTGGGSCSVGNGGGNWMKSGVVGAGVEGDWSVVGAVVPLIMARTASTAFVVGSAEGKGVVFESDIKILLLLATPAKLKSYSLA